MAVERISLSEEIWKPVVGYEGYYEVSSLGRVWSVYRAGVKSGSILRASPTAKGYMKLRLNAPVGATRYVHSLVLTAFVGPRAEGKEAAHGNGNPADNRLANLAWATSAENKRDQRLHGTQPRGESHHSAILTATQVREIKRLREQGWLWREIAAKFGVAKNTARAAGLGITWRPAGASADGVSAFTR
jgi:hypothetical protein